jgi:hypothetical protein
MWLSYFVWLQFTMSRCRFPKVSLEYFIDIILPAGLWPASNRNDYRVYFVGEKETGA